MKKYEEILPDENGVVTFDVVEELVITCGDIIITLVDGTKKIIKGDKVKKINIWTVIGKIKI